MTYLDIFSFLLLYISQIFGIISILFHGLAYFIFLIENDVKIDLLKIKNIGIRYLVESLLVVRGIDLNKENLRKAYFHRFLISLIFLLIIPILILSDV